MSDLPLIIAAAAEGEDEGGSFLVSPDIGLMIWTLLVFGISMFVLAKLAFPRIAEALDRRQRAIEDSIDAAEQTRKEADQILAEYRERLAEARGQASRAPARRARRPRPRSWPMLASSARR
jgi:F-type H+-transporting ATPase subunit b